MDLFHIRRGAGPPLVLVPGTGCEWRVWLPVLDAVAAARDVFAVDLPGLGRSAPLPAGVAPSPPALAEAVAAWFDRRGLRRPHVAGSSLGGAVALELARLGRATSVCAISPVGFGTRREMAWGMRSLEVLRALGRRLPAGVRRAAWSSAAGRALTMSQVFARPWRIPPEEAERLFDALVADSDFPRITAAAGRHRVPRGTRYDCPVTVAWGTRDRLLIPRQGRRVERVLPEARLIWLPGCGHVPMWDDPERVADLLVSASAAPGAE